jgi:hypothetical protein
MSSFAAGSLVSAGEGRLHSKSTEATIFAINRPRPGLACGVHRPRTQLAILAREAIMPALTLDEQLIFDVAVALKKVKISGFRKGVVAEGRFEVAKTIVEHLRANRWEFSKSRLQ